MNSFKKTITILIVLLFSLSTGCSNNKTVSSSKPALQKEKPLNSRLVQGKEFLIDSKVILNLKYSEVIKIWGKPKDIEQVKVHFPATVEDSYSFILKYDSIDIEMYPALKDVPVEKTTSFRFDITGNKYDLYGIRTDISLKDYLNTVKNKDVFSVKEILSDSKAYLLPYPFEYKKLLTMVKEKNYYINYDKAVYEQIVLNDFPYGAVMLFKDNILKRIVFGYPNAS